MATLLVVADSSRRSEVVQDDRSVLLPPMEESLKGIAVSKRQFGLDNLARRLVSHLQDDVPDF